MPHFSDFVLGTIFLVFVLGVAFAQPQKQTPQDAANVEIARRIGVLTIDNAHLMAAVNSLVEQNAALQAKLSAAQADCPSGPQSEPR